MKNILILLLTTMITSASPVFSQTEAHYANINGLKMYYEIHGKGYPLVLIHGGGSTINTNFGRILPALAKKHQVIAVELQAHGRTTDIDRPLSFEQDADDVAALLKELKISKANVIGFSNGASTTLQLAIRHPQTLNRIVVASTMYKRTGVPEQFWKFMENVAFETMPQQLKDGYLAVNQDQQGLMKMFNRDATRMQNFRDIPEQSIASITTPAMIVIGNQDVPSIEHAVEMHRKMSNSQLVVLPGGHGEYLGEITMPPHDDYPFVEIVDNFLK